MFVLFCFFQPMWWLQVWEWISKTLVLVLFCSFFSFSFFQPLWWIQVWDWIFKNFSTYLTFFKKVEQLCSSRSVFYNQVVYLENYLFIRSLEEISTDVYATIFMSTFINNLVVLWYFFMMVVVWDSITLKRPSLRRLLRNWYYMF